jgi:hypothetical protein
LILALVAGIVVALGLMGFQQAAAQEPSGITVTRGISPSSVPAEGGEVTVTINIGGNYPSSAIGHRQSRGEVAGRVLLRG